MPAGGAARAVNPGAGVKLVRVAVVGSSMSPTPFTTPDKLPEPSNVPVNVNVDMSSVTVKTTLSATPSVLFVPETVQLAGH